MINKYDDKVLEADELVFYVRVKFRRNASMQGKINWVDGGKSNYFRSVLELGNLLCDACKISADQSEKKLSI